MFVHQNDASASSWKPFDGYGRSYTRSSAPKAMARGAGHMHSSTWKGTEAAYNKEEVAKKSSEWWSSWEWNKRDDNGWTDDWWSQEKQDNESESSSKKKNDAKPLATQASQDNARDSSSKDKKESKSLLTDPSPALLPMAELISVPGDDRSTMRSSKNPVLSMAAFREEHGHSPDKLSKQGGQKAQQDSEKPSISIPVPSSVAGRFIGKQGVGIQELCAATGCSVRVNRSAGATQEVCISRAGKAAMSIAQAAEHVERKLAQLVWEESDTEDAAERVALPLHLVGNFIGKSGKGILDLRSALDCALKIVTTDEHAEVRIGCPADAADAVKSAAELVQRRVLDLVEKSLESSMSEMGVCNEAESDFARIEKLVAQRQDLRAAREWERADAVRAELEELGVRLDDKERRWDSKHGRTGKYPKGKIIEMPATATVLCPRQLLKAFLGPNWSGIKTLRKSCGCRIEVIDQAVEHDAKIVVGCDSDAVLERCLPLVHQRLDELLEPLSNTSDSEISGLVATWADLAKQKDWAASDATRDRLHRLGIHLEKTCMRWSSADGRSGDIPTLSYKEGPDGAKPRLEVEGEIEHVLRNTQEATPLGSKDFDFKVTRFLLAMHKHQGKEQVRTALNHVLSVTSGMSRRDVNNWSAYILALLRRYDMDFKYSDIDLKNTDRGSVSDIAAETTNKDGSDASGASLVPVPEDDDLLENDEP
eukprot:TRINITY_DN11983_c0_g1_i3.p1 TRINITY_DN11983_c0_g1~~TRINITY_DN11983_c0_g1_i3.p1  ORF type:complete len:707 (-),score=120.07 TRINITY_DN11983_c0_g1_i3:306-2426(-)